MVGVSGMRGVVGTTLTPRVAADMAGALAWTLLLLSQHPRIARDVEDELDAVRKAAARSGRSIAEVVRDAIRKVVLKPQAAGPIAIWDGKPKRTSIDHDSVHDEP